MPNGVQDIASLFTVSKERIREGFNPDIYVIGLQEIVKLNARNCFIKDTKRINLWREYLTKAIGDANNTNI